MKRMVLLVLVGIVLTGCSRNTVLRTGKLCLEPIDTTVYSTSDPNDIGPDVIDQAASMLRNELIVQIEQESKLSYVVDCLGADYFLTIKLKSLDSEINNKLIFLVPTSKIMRKYSMEVAANLGDNNKKPVLSNMLVSEDGDNLPGVVKVIAGNIIGEIRDISPIAEGKDAL